MYKAFISVLFIFIKDPETIHRLSIRFLQLLRLPGVSYVARIIFSPHPSPALAQSLWGVSFKHPIGLAGGFDKNAEAVSGLSLLGFSFLELGSVTSEAQAGNARQRIFRFAKDRAVINRMGFNNEGRHAMRARLEKVSHETPLGISLGKLKTVELHDAPKEYALSYETLYDYGEYFVVNVSSPNTPGLRSLQDKDALIAIVEELNRFRKIQKVQKPLLVKIAPDLTYEAIDEVLAVCADHSLDGIIATNTTVSREGLSEPTSELGGLSGMPLKARSTNIIRYIHQKNPMLPIIGVGGIFTAEDAYEKIKAGASLIQLYTGFIYEGPFLVKNIVSELPLLLARDGYTTLAEAIGVESRV